MFKFPLIATILLIAPVSALAEPGNAVQRAVAKCWMVPADSSGNVRIAFALDASGAVVPPLTVLEGGEKGVLVVSAMRAIKRCAPYAEALEGVAEFPFDVEILFDTGASAN